jgi:hypothetical protein
MYPRGSQACCRAAQCSPVPPSLAEPGVVPGGDVSSDRTPLTEFWVAKWIVPADAPLGVVRYIVTARDPQGRTGRMEALRERALPAHHVE